MLVTAWARVIVFVFVRMSVCLSVNWQYTFNCSNSVKKVGTNLERNGKSYVLASHSR